MGATPKCNHIGIWQYYREHSPAKITNLHLQRFHSSIVTA
ncbi:hypothetical protein CRENPOLYSF1_20009 [Crenothrix polyspora]|uniref:Uncharacterized protein n=1 Tax=Crenothrix polyspora TaxID=360316 RepID=A0A1R4H5J6_9GAMM|nr:hypothetical protein CRENPOLYSF1_20009 [Crenothrix polyspora]